MNRALIVALVIVAIIAAIWGYRAYTSPATPNYILAEVQTGKLRHVVNATGVVHTVFDVDVGSQVSGRIDEVFVDFNDSVRLGQPIARLDQHSFQANLDGAIAALEVAKARLTISEAGIDRARNALASSMAKAGVYAAHIDRARAVLQKSQLALDRAQDLSEKRVLSLDDVDNVKTEAAKSKAELDAAISESQVQKRQISISEADLRSAQGRLLEARSLIPQRAAALKLAEVELERTLIRSPIDGIIIDRAIEPGQTVAASLEAPKLFTIARDLQTMEVHTMIDESDIGQIRVGQDASFSVDAYPDRNFNSTVRQIRKSPNRNRGVVSYATIIATENPDLLLLPGMPALVRITVTESEAMSKIPHRALNFQPTSTAASAFDGSSSRDESKGALLTPSAFQSILLFETGMNRIGSEYRCSGFQ